MLIEKKVNCDSFERILNGSKKYELRLADFNVSEGDILILKEWDSKNRKLTGREIKKEVTFVERTNELTYWKKEEVDKFGYQIISFE